MDISGAAGSVAGHASRGSGPKREAATGQAGPADRPGPARSTLLSGRSRRRTPPLNQLTDRLSVYKTQTDGRSFNTVSDLANAEAAMTFLDCPARLDQEGAVRCGLPAEVWCRFTMRSTDGPEQKAHRPNSAPAYYLGHPACLWITVMRPHRRGGASEHAPYAPGDAGRARQPAVTTVGRAGSPRRASRR
jgi:hypothetical protein